MATVDVSILWGLALATIVVALATLLPMLRHPHWVFRGLDFPRLQLAVVALVLLLLQLALLDMNHPFSWFLVTATGLSLGVQLWWILPYTVLWPREVKAARHGDPERTLWWSCVPASGSGFISCIRPRQVPPKIRNRQSGTRTP
ncbi:hypothetical protein [Marinobacter sp.]|uniref:hypothetical protein n=1 Tax=Marinobacter sp. TaxID=50741 RepID=UPI0023555E49|nr:hypothetical protein [Marinobacter sp.]